MNSLTLIRTKFTRNHSRRVISIWPPQNPNPLSAATASNSPHLHLPNRRQKLLLRRRRVLMRVRIFMMLLLLRRKILRMMIMNRLRLQRRLLRVMMMMLRVRLSNNHNRRRVTAIVNILHRSRNFKNPSFLNHHNLPRPLLIRYRFLRRRLILRRLTTTTTAAALRGCLLSNNLLVKIVNSQPNLTPNPTKHTLLLQRYVKQTLLTSLSKLAPVQLHPPQEMVFTATATVSSIPLVVKNLNLKLLRVHVFRVGNLELDRLVPSRVEVTVLGGGPLLLAVEIHHHVGAGTALPIFRKKVTCVHHVYN
ncbi:hypothetical protein RGQ29_003923 [Quercus rubra]|uniref:Uncharacterized protein n=1 Tax=Quercus rubra TaxID=3512 RepID=A0AAN7EDE9_QUERU|nr:hypothetical protein RGQ29_003923 [Quercus rubra]